MAIKNFLFLQALAWIRAGKLRFTCLSRAVLENLAAGAMRQAAPGIDRLALRCVAGRSGSPRPPCVGSASRPVHAFARIRPRALPALACAFLLPFLTALGTAPAHAQATCDGLVFDPTSLTLAENESADYTVKLNGAPPSATSVTFTSAGAPSIIRIPTNPNNELIFTTANWNTPQTVTVTGVPDMTIGDRSTTIRHTIGGGCFQVAGVDLSVTVTDVPVDSMPSFGGSTVSNQTYVQHRKITDLTLPAATGGDGTLTYSLAGPAGAALPAGLSFDANTRKLTGTPTGSQSAMTYTYKVTDGDASDPDSAELTFNIAITANAVPSFGGATVTNKTYIQHRKIDDLTLPAATGGDGTLSYHLEEDGTAGTLPAGLSFDANTRKLTGTPTGSQSATTYQYYVQDSTLVGGDRDLVGLSFKITITANAVPGFGGATVANQSYTQNTLISALDLPDATGGDGTLTYQLVGTLPAGLNYDSTDREITGTPTATQAATTYTWRATDNNGDKVELTFDITVSAADLMPSFGMSTVGNQSYPQHREITELTLPAATGGDGTLTYELTGPSGGAPPAGLNFNATSRKLTGTPTTVQSSTTYTYKVTDGDATNPDSAQLTFTITVTANAVPSFGGSTVSNQSYTQNMQITELTLPAATGGDGTLTYSLEGPSGGALPAGLSFDANTRKLTGTPTGSQSATTYTYKASDNNGDDIELTFTITITAVGDQMPSFGMSTVADQSYPQSREIDELTLPAATGGDGTLTYELTGPSGGALPAGLSFDANTRKLTGTPTTVQAATTYTYKVTDGDSSSPDSAELTFDITVTANLVPKFAAGAAIPDLVFAVNKLNLSPPFPQATGGDGTHTYSVEETLPTGLRFDGSARQLLGTPTSTQSAMTYTFVAEDNNGDKVSLSFKLSVTANATPSFGASTIDDQVLTKDDAMTPVTLPTATSGNPPLTYGFKPSLPAGLSFEESGGVWTLKGTPTARQDAASYAWEAEDRDGEVAEIDFTITVVQGTAPSFSTTIGNQSYTQNTDIGTLQLPTATGGDGTLTYLLLGDLPTGLSFDRTNRRVTGTPTGTQNAVTYTWQAEDTDGDKAELTFTITVASATDQMPTFDEGASIAAQDYTKDTDIGTLQLPAATGGDGTLTYTLEGPGGEGLPAGLSFNANTRQLTGTPTTVQSSKTYTYKATDSDASNPDSAELTFTITVSEADTAPTFGMKTILDQTFGKDLQINTLTLPAATGGNGTLTYSLAPQSGGGGGGCRRG